MEKTVENDGSTFTFEDNNISPDTSRTPIDSRHETPFQKDGDYPRSVCVAQQRLVFASTKNQPETLWMSAVGDFTNFSEHEVQNVDDSIEFSLPVTRFAKLNHIVEMKQLIAFNSACEWVIESTSTTQGITYETICARPQSYSGTNSRLKPLVCDNSVLFAERTGQAVRRYAYDVTSDGFAGRDVSVLSSSIFDRNCIVDWTYQQFPFSTVWCVLLDGTMASFTFMEEQDIMAWATHRHAGGRVLAVSTSHAVAPGLHEITQEEGAEREEAYSGCSNEEVFIVLKDKNDGKLYLERMRPRCKGADSVFNALCLDSMELGTSATDGRVQVGDWVGYPIESEFTSVYPVVGDGIGVGQLDVKGIVNVGLRLKESHGGRVKAAADPGEGEPIRYGADVKTESGGVVTLRNHDADNIKPRGCNSRDGRITVKHGEPWPFGIISLETDYAVES